MRIVCIGYFHGSGGAEKQILMLSNALADRGHEVHLIALAKNNIKFHIQKNVLVHDLSYSEEYRGNKIFNRFKILKKVLIDIHPNITINYWFQSTYFCAIMPKYITGKIIYSERGDPGDKEYSGLLGLVRDLSFKRVDGFVFQSEGAKSYFNEKIQQKSIVIHNSVSIPEKYRDPCLEREKRIVTVGRLHQQKNQKLLIDAFSKIHNQIPEYILEIYGEGDLKDNLQQQINSLKMKNKIFLRGTSDKILDYVYNSSLFVLSSDYEGLPNALMEALSLGVPCISTDCKPGGARTLIHNGINGWIVPRNDIDALATMIKKVIASGNDFSNLKKESTKFRELHSDETVFNKWNQFLESI